MGRLGTKASAGIAARPRHRINEKELRVHAVMGVVILLGIGAWILSVSGPITAFTRPTFPDLSQFQAGARMIADDRIADLYQPKAFLEVLKTVAPWPQQTLFPPVYPVHVYAAFLPIAHLPYHWAVFVISTVSLTLYAAGVYVLGRPSGVPLTLRLLAAGNPALLHTVMSGQLSAVSFMQLALVWWAWRGQHRFVAGLVLGSFVWKPPLLLFAATAVIVKPSWRLAAGCAAGAVLQIAIVSLAFGPGVWTAYLGVLRLVSDHPGMFSSPHHFQSIKGALGLVLAPGPLLTGLWVGLSLVVLALAWWIGRRTPDERVAFATVVVSGLLVSPHVYVYDALLYSAALFLVGQAALERGRSTRSDLAAYALHWTPLLLPLVAVSRIQLSSVLGLAWLGLSLIESGPPPSSALRGPAAEEPRAAAGAAGAALSSPLDEHLPLRI